MSANEFAKRMMHVVPGHETLFESVCAGTFAGFINSFIVGPVELVKCKMQMQTTCHKTAKYKSSFDCFKQIYGEKGV